MHSVTSSFSSNSSLVQSWTYDNIDCQFVICETCFWNATIFKFSEKQNRRCHIHSCPLCSSNNIYLITITKDDICEIVIDSKPN